MQCLGSFEIKESELGTGNIKSSEDKSDSEAICDYLLENTLKKSLLTTIYDPTLQSKELCISLNGQPEPHHSYDTTAHRCNNQKLARRIDNIFEAAENMPINPKNNNRGLWEQHLLQLQQLKKELLAKLNNEQYNFDTQQALEDFHTQHMIPAYREMMAVLALAKGWSISEIEERWALEMVKAQQKQPPHITVFASKSSPVFFHILLSQPLKSQNDTKRGFKTTSLVVNFNSLDKENMLSVIQSKEVTNYFSATDLYKKHILTLAEQTCLFLEDSEVKSEVKQVYLSGHFQHADLGHFTLLQSKKGLISQLFSWIGEKLKNIFSAEPKGENKLALIQEKNVAECENWFAKDLFKIGLSPLEKMELWFDRNKKNAAQNIDNRIVKDQEKELNSTIPVQKKKKVSDTELSNQENRQNTQENTKNTTQYIAQKRYVI